MKFYYTLLLCAVSTTAVTISVIAAPGVAHIQQHQSTEDKLTTKLFQLPEVKKLDKELKKYKANASVMITDTPTRQNPYYEISVGYNGPDRFENRYLFRVRKDYINQANIEPYVQVMDVVNADYISLAQYRKQKH